MARGNPRSPHLNRVAPRSGRLLPRDMSRLAHELDELRAISVSILTLRTLRLRGDVLVAELARIRAAPEELCESGHRRRERHFALHDRAECWSLERDRL